MYATNTLGDVSLTAGSGGIDWGNILSSAVQGYTQIQGQKLQLERARRGLSPIDLTSYAAPPVRVQTTVAPGEGTNRTLMLAGGIGLAGIALLMLMRRPRR